MVALFPRLLPRANSDPPARAERAVILLKIASWLGGTERVDLDDREDEGVLRERGIGDGARGPGSGGSPCTAWNRVSLVT